MVVVWNQLGKKGIAESSTDVPGVLLLNRIYLC